MSYIVIRHDKEPARNIFCIGRNYIEHAHELNNPVPEAPLVFFKPTGTLLHEGSQIPLPVYSEDVHHEAELVLFINKDAEGLTKENALNFIGAIGLGLDLTARDIQSIEKSKGHPWSRSKGFKGAAPISKFIPFSEASMPLGQIRFSLDVNGERRQTGHLSELIFDIPTLLEHLNSIYGLQKGDLVFTGTPKGVAKMKTGDEMSLKLTTSIDPDNPTANEIVTAEFTVA